MDIFYIDRGNLTNVSDSKNCNDDDHKPIENSDVLCKNFKNDLKSDLFYNLPNLKNDVKSKTMKKKHENSAETYIISNHMKSIKEKNYFSYDTDSMKNNVSTTGLEKEYLIPTVRKKILKLRLKKLRGKTKGRNWFNMSTSEVTNDVKADFQILKMRSVLDKNHVYKKNNIKHISKYFQIGTVIENPADFYNGRIPKSQRKKTIVDELLADTECKNYQKKKYKEIMNTKGKKHIKNRKMKKK